MINYTRQFSVSLSGVSTEVVYSENPLERIDEIRGGLTPFYIFDSTTQQLTAFSGEKQSASSGAEPVFSGGTGAREASAGKKNRGYSYLSEYSYVIEAGEQYKNRDTLFAIAEKLLELQAGRDTLIVAVGGGVVCDIAAFVASVYMRGVRLVLVPSTLLAMVDASLGGKTGIDFGGYKNIIGTFYPAEELIITPSLLESLPQEEYLNGLAEVIKHGLLDKEDETLLSILTDRRKEVLGRERKTLEEIVYISQKIKARFVEADPKEQNERGFLNLGHTFGHALESLGGFTGKSHGEAVAWGIAKAMDAGVAMGLSDKTYAEEVKQLLKEYGYQIYGLPADPRDLIEAMNYDKKKKADSVRFVLQKKRGESLFSRVPRETLLEVLKNG